MSYKGFDLWKLKKRIRESGYTQASFANAIGMPYKTFYTRLNGSTVWTLRDLQRIKQALPDISISEIFFI